MAVSAYPDISKTPITKDTEFVICACDGIWDCMTSQQACDFVVKARAKLRDYTAEQKSPTDSKLTKTNSNSNSKVSSVKPAGAPPKKIGSKSNSKLEAPIDNSKFKGLATVVEMMMENNCPANLAQSEGLGADNMTCIIIEFNRK